MGVGKSVDGYDAADGIVDIVEYSQNKVVVVVVHLQQVESYLQLIEGEAGTWHYKVAVGH